MPASALRVSDITAGFGGQKVLRGVSIDVSQGSLVTLIGPNGHGKTTLLRCISGLMRPWSGQILLGESEITDLKPHKIVERGVTHIPQGDLIFPDMTVYDNLMMGAYLPGAYAKAEGKLAEVYALLPRLRERAGQVASTLSGGERRMLSIGRGLMGDGTLLMIDEPSLGLAPLVIDQIYDVIRDLKSRGLSILVVEENASRAMEIGDWVYLLDDGKIVWQGEPSGMMENEEILATYLGG